MTMYNLARPDAPWYEHLADSVRALGDAAREWQIADQKAAVLEADVELLRRNLNEGAILVHGPRDGGWEAKPHQRGPHEHAVFDLQKIYLGHRHLTRRWYEHAATLFAAGAAWAIARVRAGEQPSACLFKLDDDRRPIPGSFRIEPFERYANGRKLTAAYERLISMEASAEYAEDLAGQDYVTDHEAGEMFEASEHASGLAAAAYAYGLLAEQALQFALLGPKQAHREQLAQERAAVEQRGEVAQ
ncbi:hypothetical protein [Streptomyces sp. NPDC051014]|uniref:hypothetical protein n=1 Tax=Streptomyces sp. NPDC051014 TaxID=3155751 RepID=UPI0033F1E6C3